MFKGILGESVANNFAETKINKITITDNAIVHNSCLA